MHLPNKKKCFPQRNGKLLPMKVMNDCFSFVLLNLPTPSVEGHIKMMQEGLLKLIG